MRAVALSSSRKAGQRLHDLFQYRFSDGGLAGMSFGNLFLAALEKITGSFEEALRAASDILAVEGKVIPSTLTDTHLCAVLEDGTIVIPKLHLQPNAPDGTMPMIFPRSYRLPKGSLRREFNGIPFYIVQIDNRTE